MTAVPESQEEPQVAGDPTQHLLTALGRFQRQVAKGETGAPQDTWSDECMTQLIRGIELAHTQGWSDVQEALTDTARVLQSYENAGAAFSCVPFLQDSYEILCLMVGDLIVDNVRSGVMQKWRERYQRAVGDVQAAGYMLVGDDEQQSHQALSTQDSAGEEEVAMAAEPSETVFESMEEELASEPEAHIEPVEAGLYREMEAQLPEMPEDDAPVAADTVEGTDDTAVAETVREETAEEMIVPFELPADSPPETYGAPPRALGGDNLPSLDELIGGQGEITAVEEETQAPSTGEETTEALEGRAHTAIQIEAEITASAELGMAGTAGQNGDSPCSGTREDSPRFALEETPESPGEAFAVDTAPASWEEPAESVTPKSSVEEQDIDVAGAPAETEEGPMTAGEAQSAEPDADPLVRASKELFQTTQAAISRGDVAGAKAMALRLAANMAKIEEQYAERALDQAEALLAGDGRAIAAAQEEVGRAEKSVQEAEWLVGEREAEFQKKREHVATLHGQQGQLESTIAELDRQIGELQERRNAQAQRMAEIQAEVEEAASLESRVQTELDDLAAIGESARNALEDGRRQVEQLEQQRSAREAEIASARERLEQQRKTTADIEQTISAIEGGAAPGAPPRAPGAPPRAPGAPPRAPLM